MPSISGYIRATQDLECLLQGVNLRLPCRYALIPRHAPINALRHQSVVVALCSQKLILSSLEIRGLFLDLRFGCCPISFVHLSFPQLSGPASLAVHHKSFVCLCSCSLCCMSVCLQSCKVRGDHLKQSQNSILRF